MEYKGYTITRTKNGNVSIKNDKGEYIIVSHDRGFLNEDELKVIVDRATVGR
nr:MAG TPA: hypothetical protein [Caudoviricetes sp.]